MTGAVTPLAQFSAEKRRVALHSMAAAAALTLLKLAAGLFSGSLGVLSDAAHSALDLAGSALTFFSVRVADKPADEDHSYGHGKFENLSAFGEAGLMAVSCAWIVWEAMQRIIRRTFALHHSLWPLLVLLLSIAVDIWRSRQLRAVADHTGSPALATDAFHFASDIWSTVAVLAGLGAASIGQRLEIEWLQYADPCAAIVVSLMILRLTLRLGRETVAVLVDEVPAEVRSLVLGEVKKVKGVMEIEQARVRRAGAAYFADFTLALPRTDTFEHTGELVREVTDAVHRVLPEADVVIHTVPRQEFRESIFDRVRAVAARNNVNVHDLSVQSRHGKLRAELHIELDEKLPLQQAHSFVTSLEAQILREAPEIGSVLTHIESEPATIEQPQEMAEAERKIAQALRKAASEFPEIKDVHEITVSRLGEQIYLTCHCTLPDNLAMKRVHEVITSLEDRFKLECSEVHRVTIHPEPTTDNRR
jgi:cation diffusion facilitator family transporter